MCSSPGTNILISLFSIDIITPCADNVVYLHLTR